MTQFLSSNLVIPYCEIHIFGFYCCVITTHMQNIYSITTFITLILISNLSSLLCTKCAISYNFLSIVSHNSILWLNWPKVIQLNLIMLKRRYIICVILFNTAIWLILFREPNLLKNIREPKIRSFSLILGPKY